MKRTVRLGAVAMTLVLAAGAQAIASPNPDVIELQDKAEKVTAEVLVLHATNDGSGVDPEIGKLPALSEPPFSSYDSYKLLSRDRLPLSKDKAATKTLPNERVLGVTFKGLAPKQEGSDRERYKVSTSIRKPGGTSFLPVLEVNAPAGKYFFVAGQTHKDGILVIGIKIVE